MPNPCASRGERGTQVVGANPRFGGGAGSFSASPSANPVGPRRSCWFARSRAWTHTCALPHSSVLGLVGCAWSPRAIAATARAGWRRSLVPPTAGPRAASGPPPPASRLRPHRARRPALARRRTAIPPAAAPAAGQGRDLRRQPDHDQAVPLRRRPPPLQRHGLRLLGLASATRCTAAACSTRPLHSSAFMRWGERRPRPLDHRLHESRATPTW